ncbi:ubiquitin-like FUBI-ribosomal protein eS30 fusion protein, partial [Rattus norvegicus]|uniref:ubiquitin-like FUBI-ribosomal protein eS30 fusion protein n=1 Tax=Rattus norvegicus TaxID=10116 RepID=UPI002FD7E76B
LHLHGSSSQRPQVSSQHAALVHSQELPTPEVTGQETVTQIKAHVASLEGVAPEDQVVLLAGSTLEDEATLAQCGVEALTSLEVAGCMLGGKVHGVLQLAGKVRGQTPKVAKQEKKRRKTGRARRHMQYNRRFVNVVPTLGNKKGPNSIPKSCCDPTVLIKPLCPEKKMLRAYLLELLVGF